MLSKVTNTHSILRSITYVFLAVILSISSVVTILHATANAESFNPGKIIDDSVFTNRYSMGVPQIQAFLNSKVPVCDTAGTQPSEYGGGTRAQWAQAKYGQSSFTCLKDYTEGGKSSAQIINDVAQTYAINPQVLIVLLQKEQGLVTDAWPLNIQYRSATGYGCPDSTPGVCDSSYYGFTNQLTWAAKMFRAILNVSPTWYTPYILGSNYIQYSPTASCGGSNVIIQNRSTQALYNYTPYQPNGAAQAAPMGATVTCGAYGNLNFFRYFTSWFGTTQQIIPAYCTAPANNTTCVWRLTDPSTGYQFLTSSIDERNSVISNGYTYSGIAFYARGSQTPNSIAVYRILLRSGEHMWTSSASEKNSLISAGATSEGIGWYTDASDANTGYPVYRLSGGTGHILTGDTTERDQLVRGGGYTLEGTVFNSPSPFVEVYAPDPGYTHVYRLYKPSTDTHFWTTSIDERDILINSGFTYEGASLEARSSATSYPVYRLYKPATGKHFWTTSPQERDILLGGGYVYEGIAWYTTNTGTAMYRLYKPTTDQHFWTTSPQERDILLGGGYRYEGVALTTN